MAALPDIRDVNMAAPIAGVRFTSALIAHGASGLFKVVRTGTLTGEVSPHGMRRVEWDEGGFGRMGWI